MTRAVMLARRMARKRDSTRTILVTFAMAAALTGPLALQHARRDPPADERSLACGFDLHIAFGPIGSP